MAELPQEVQEQIELEKRALAIVHAVLSDTEFIQGTLEGYWAEVNGEEGEDWEQIKAELGLA